MPGQSRSPWAPPATEKASNLDVPGYRIVLNNGAINRADSQYPDQGGISVQHFSDLDADDASALAQKLGSTLDAEQTQFAQINSARFEDEIGRASCRERV